MTVLGNKFANQEWFQLAASYSEKRKILDMPTIKVTATPERINIEGVIPLELTSAQLSESPASLLTTGQTWA
jgi:hypothetical protein